MKIIRINDNTAFLGYDKNLGIYGFITRFPDGHQQYPTIEAYSECKIVDCGSNDVYYCEVGGRITRKWKPIDRRYLKSMINGRNSAAFKQYKQLLGWDSVD